MLALDKPWDWIIIAVIFIALFGYKKLPDAARSVGRSLRIFKTEIKGMTGDDKTREQARAEQADPEPAAPKALPPAEFVRRETVPPPADRPRPRPAPAPAAGPRGTDAG